MRRVGFGGIAGGRIADMPQYLDNDGAWHSCRVNEKELMRVLSEIEAEGTREIKFIVPYRLPVGREPGDALYAVIVRDRM
jgi:hypothetical protein